MLLDPIHLDRPDVLVADAPFAFLVAPAQLPDAQRATLLRDFPRYGSAGFFPYRAEDCGPSMRALVEELSGGAIATAIGLRLGIPDLAGFPVLVTVSDSVHRRHGTIHTDSSPRSPRPCSISTHHGPGPAKAACVCSCAVTTSSQLAAPEIRPLYGTLVAFRRADNSWHGHLPFEGERRVLQVAWLASAADVERKNRRGRFSRMVKAMAGALDRRWGARRGVNAKHQ